MGETEGEDGQAALDAEDADYLLDRAFEDYACGKALIGSPESCARVIERLQRIGVDEVGCFVDFGVTTWRLAALASGSSPAIWRVQAPMLLKNG